ncbi:MAG: hypothetical protein AAF547_06745 [Actinomycetota bacterium]
MEVWIGLVGAVAGATVAFAGQYFVSRAELGAAHRASVLEHCVELIALSEDFRNRLWEERRLATTGSVQGWDLNAYRRAEAALRLLTQDAQLHAAVDELRQTGQDLGSLWRRRGHDGDQEQLESYLNAHQAAIKTFIRIANVHMQSL